MTSQDSPVQLSIDAAVATITLSRPHALNAITREMLLLLADALDAVAADESVRVVVLTGEGRAFSAGVDLKALNELALEGGEVGDLLDLPARAAVTKLATIPKVVIAKVNGFCFTGALELALACDMIVAADEAKLGDTHAKWGLRPTWGMSQRLVDAVGITRARLLSYTAQTFTGQDAAAWGLAVSSVPLADLDETVSALVASIISNSAGSIAAYKDLYRTALNRGLDDGLAYEASTTYPIADSGDRLSAFR